MNWQRKGEECWSQVIHCLFPLLPLFLQRRPCGSPLSKYPLASTRRTFKVCKNHVSQIDAECDWFLGVACYRFLISSLPSMSYVNGIVRHCGTLFSVFDRFLQLGFFIDYFNPNMYASVQRWRILCRLHGSRRSPPNASGLSALCLWMITVRCEPKSVFKGCSILSGFSKHHKRRNCLLPVLVQFVLIRPSTGIFLGIIPEFSHNKFNRTTASKVTPQMPCSSHVDLITREIVQANSICCF